MPAEESGASLVFVLGFGSEDGLPGDAAVPGDIRENTELPSRKASEAL